MQLHHWLKSLYFLGLEFWLPLPVLGLIFCLGGNLITERILSQPYSTVNKLKADIPPEFNLSGDILIIQAKIDTIKGMTQVYAKTTDLPQKTLAFELPVTEVSQVEIAIAQELGLSIESIRKLVRYQIMD